MLGLDSGFTTLPDQLKFNYLMNDSAYVKCKLVQKIGFAVIVDSRTSRVGINMNSLSNVQ